MRIVTFNDPSALDLIAQLNTERGFPPHYGLVTKVHAIGAVGDDTTGDVSFDWGSLPSAILQLLQAPSIIEAQNKLREINVQRAAQGLPPLSQSYLTAVQPGVNVNLSDATKNTLIIGAIIIGALFVFARR